MNRRRFLQTAATGAMAAWLGRGAAAAETKTPPNIIYILADDAGYGDVSCYGQKLFTTPSIDRLAAEGLKFTQHYSGSTVCAPSRCSLMTGLHTGHCFVRGNREVQPVGQSPMPAETITIPRLLKKAGYATGMFGKWGLGAPGSASDPAEHFDEFFGYNCQRNAHTYYPKRLFHNRQAVELDGKTYSHDLIVDKALAFVRASAAAGKPFFCYMPVTIPHASLHVPEKYAAPFRKKFPQFEDKIGRYSGPQIKNPAACFAGMMVKLDESVGQVLALLKELGLDANTIVMFTSDNGPHREGGHQPDFFDSNGPLAGLKRSLTEGGIRVPMLARWPGKIKPGACTDHISAFWDVLPTVCDLAGAKAPDKIDGISFVPTLLGQPGKQKAHPYLYWEFYEGGGKRAVRMGKWKAIQRNLNKALDGPILLYDLDADLAETKDLAKDQPDVLAEVRAIFRQAHTPSEVFIWGGTRK